MPFSQSKTTFVRPLCEPNNSGNVYKSYTAPIQPFTPTQQVFSAGMHTKLGGDLKNLDEMKSKQLSSLNSVHSKLFAEVEEIQKWKTEVEMESRQKNKKVEELMQTIESQRKVVLDVQLQNENLSYRLSEEIQQRSFVLENLHSTKELCSALKKHYNTLQGQFDYRNKIEDMINVANTKRISAIEDLENKFEKICIEHSERIGCLNDALATETNKALNLQEALQREVSLYDNEKQSLCTLLSNSQLEIEKLSKGLEEETIKARNLFQEKRDLEMNVIQLEKANEAHVVTIEETKRNLEILQGDRDEIEKKYFTQCSQNKDIAVKYEECVEAAKCLKLESEENIFVLKQTIERLECKCSNLLKSLEEEQQTGKTLSLSLENIENEKNNLDKIIIEANNELNLFENLKNEHKVLTETFAKSLEEKENLTISLENTMNDLSNRKVENESFAKLLEEKQDSLIKLSEEYKTEMSLKESDIANMKEEYDKLELKCKGLEEDIADKCKCMHSRDEEIANLQAVIQEKETSIDSITKKNVVLKENFEIERTSLKVCLECEASKDKLAELENLKNTLKKTEEDLQLQKRYTADTMRMLNEAEKVYNGDRIAKEKELIQYKNQLKQAEDNIKFNYIERETYNNLKSENEKLNEDIKEIEIKLEKLSCENLSLVNKAAQNSEALKETSLNLQKTDSGSLSTSKRTKKISPLKAKLRTRAKRMDTNSKNKKSQKMTNKEIIKICKARFRKRTAKENETSNDIDSSSKTVDLMDITSEPETNNLKQAETNSTSSDNDFEKIQHKETEKQKRWEVDSISSGSEYMDISFYQQQETPKAPISSFKPSTPKVENIKNKPSFNSAIQQKREIQDIKSTLNKRPCGGTPLRSTPQSLSFKNQTQFKSTVWTPGLRTPDKSITTPDLNITKINSQGTPISTPQRRFFKTTFNERDEHFKKPKPKSQWF